MRNSVLTGAICAFFCAGAAHAASVTFDPTADGDVQVFGGDDVDSIDDVLSVTQSGGLARNAIFEFDLSSIADDATIDAVTFSFTITRFVSNTGGNPAAVELFAYSGDGVVDIDDFGASATQVVDSTAAGGGSAGDTFDFSFGTVAPVQDALAGDELTVRFETNSFASIALAALENTSFDAATLTVDYTPAPGGGPAPVPLPAGLPMLLAGLGAMAWVRRKA